MSLWVLIWSYLKARPLNTAINVALLSLGVAVILVLLLFNNQLQQKLTENTKGIDLVVGAKGSPLQLILCNIFHIDFPTGNINLREAEKIAKSSMVKRAIPLALGDAYRTYRIIGTNQQYPALYKAEIAQGVWWKKDMEVTLGNKVKGLRIGDKFSSAHGLTAGGHEHDTHQYIVKGIMKPTYSVLDNLILTNIESIWLVHQDHDDTLKMSEVHDFVAGRLVTSVSANDSTREITSMLVQYRSPLAAINLPRMVNAHSGLQAASPAFETARLFTILGVGVDIMMAFAYVLIAMASISIFIALYNSLKERRYDMAIMRSMGASRAKLFNAIILEGMTLSILGGLIGLAIGHGILLLMSGFVEEMGKAGISGVVFYREEWILLGGSVLLGIGCALIPAIQAYRTDISKVLSGN